MPRSRNQFGYRELKCGERGCDLPPRFHAINLPELKATRDSNRVIVKLEPTGRPAHHFVFTGN